MAKTGYFSSPTPRVLAHRGLHLNKPGVIENSLDAFRNALEHGATHIESDVHATGDKVAVLFHDEDLVRTFSDPHKISQLSITDLGAISNNSIPTLEQALGEFPETYWNLDLKSWQAIEPAVSVIEKVNAHDRVLISSFSDKRRKAALAALSKPVATSAGSGTVLRAMLANYLLGGFGLKRILQDVDALQIPTSQGFLRLDSEKFISRIRQLDKEVHYWTVNEVSQMEELLAKGAHGIVTDRVDLFPRRS